MRHVWVVEYGLCCFEGGCVRGVYESRKDAARACKELVNQMRDGDKWRLLRNKRKMIYWEPAHGFAFVVAQMWRVGGVSTKRRKP